LRKKEALRLPAPEIDREVVENLNV